MQNYKIQKTKKLYSIVNIFQIIFILPLLMISTLKADTVLIDLSSNLSIVPTTVEVSQDFNSTITIKNETTGSTTLDGNGATIKYHVPNGATYSGTYNSNSGWSCDGNIDNNGDISCQYNQTLNNGDTSNPLIITLAAPTATGTSNPSVTVTATTTDANTSNDTSTASVEFGKSNLQATKTASVSNTGLNQNFTYTLTISNPDNGTNPTVKARNVTITDTLPNGINFVSLSDTSWCSQSNGVVNCNGVDLDPGNSRSVTITVNASTGGSKTNTASINADSSDYNSLPLTPSATVTIEPADIALSKTLLNGIDANNAEVNSTVIYHISVKNNGQTSAEDVNFTDTLPTGVSYVNISAGNWNCSGTSTINCSLTTPLSYNETQDVNITVKMPSTHQTLNNTATAVTSTDQSGHTSDDTDTLTTYVRGVDLKITKSGDNATANAGSNFTYTITVKNNGLVNAQNVVVTDNLDSRMTYVNDTGNCSVNAQTLTCTHQTLNSGDSYSFDITVKMPTDSLNDVTNSASVTNDIDEENPSDNSVSSTTHLLGPDLEIAKDANVSEVGLGKLFTYTLHISSQNDINATDVNITDTLPSGVEITNINSGSFNCPSTPVTGTFSCSKTNFQGNSSDTIVLTAKAPSNSTGDITNNVIIAQSLNSNDGSDSATVTVTGVTLDITKNASPVATVGGLIDYNVTVTNTSHADAQNVTVTDNLSSSLGSGYTVNSIIDATGWNCNGVGTTTLSCTKNSDLLAEGDNSTIHFDVNVPLNASLGTVTNSVDVNTSTLPKPNNTATASTIIEGSDIVVIPPSTTTAVANENVVFTVKVRNDGSATAKDVNITNTFNTSNISGADFTNIKIDCNNDGTYDITSSPYTCSLGDIAKNETKTITISATAPNYDSNFPGHSNITNNSNAVTSSTESNSANNNINWQIQNHGADIVIYKDANQSEVAVNNLITYDLYITNQWEANATNIKIDDNTLGSSDDRFTFVNGSLSYNSSDWSCNQDTSTHFSCTYKKDLAQNQTTSHITIQAKAPNTLSTIDNERGNEADISTDTAEKETATTNSKIANVTIRGADLTISKTVSPNPAKLNESVTYTITVTNNGLAEAKDTNVSDTLPNGFTNISTSGCDNDGNNISGQSVNCTLGDLAQNASKSFTITTNAPNINGTYINTATTSSNTLEKNTADNNASAILQVQGADLIPHKTAPARVAGNSTFTYVISLANTGSSTAYGAEINDTIPTNNGTTYVSGSLNTLDSDWTCSLSGSDIHCYTNDSNLSIPNGYNHNIVSFQVKAGPAHYWIHNTVVTDTNTSESNIVNNSYTADTEVIDVDLQARKLINGTNYGANENYIDINGTLVYKIQVRNGSLVDLNITDVNVTDILPNNVTNISINADSRFDCSTTPFHLPSGGVEAGDKLFCTMKDADTNPLQRNEGWIDVATITVNAIDSAHFDINDENNNFIINKYKAETSLSDQNLANNAPTAGDEYLHTNTLVRGSNMSITKTVSNDPIGANKNFFYTLSVRNWPRNSTAQHDIPSTTATNIVVKDILPNDINFTGASGTNWSCSENSHIITCNYNGTLAPGNSASNITLNVTAPNTDSEVLTNEANVTNDTPELVRILPDNNDSVQTTTMGTDLSIAKTGPATAGMSDPVTYSITVTNQSAQADAKGVYIIDTLPNGATFDGNISDSHWSSTVEANGSIRFTYDQTLPMSTTSNFTFSATLPHYTGIARNHVEVFTNTAETTTANNQDDWDTDIQGADLIFKNIPTQNPNPVGAYKHHEYYIVVRNQGLSPANDINVTINFNDAGSTPGWKDINGSGTNWNCDIYDDVANKLVCHLPTLARNSDSSTLSISSTAPNHNGDITNSATVIGKDDTNTTTGETKSTVTTVKGSDLKIIKYAKDPDPHSDGLYHDTNITVGVGKEINFKLTITNQNIGLAKDINITDTLPTGFSDINITNPGDWNCSIASNTIVCFRTSLDANTNAADILYSATTPGALGNVTNTAHINTSTDETDTTNNTSSIDIKLEGATLNASFNPSKTQVAMGEAFSYILDINNTGRNPAIDINTSDILPSDFSYIDNNGSDSGWVCSESGNHISCTQPNIVAYGGTSQLRLNVLSPVNSIGTYSNDINISSNSIENSILSVAPNVRVVGADLKVDINASTNEVLEDRNVTYTINIKDINISTAHDINITQIFSEPINGLFISNSGGAVCTLADNNQSVKCNINSLSYNEDKNITVVATMPNTASVITLTSSVTVSTLTAQENTSNDTSSANVKVYPIKPNVDYRFDECDWSGNNAVLDSIGSLNATAKNGAHTLNQIVTQDDNNFSTIWRVGDFDGNNDYIHIPNSNIVNLTEHYKRTISLWFNAKNVALNKNQVIYEEGGGLNGLAIYIKNSKVYIGGWNHSTNWDNGTYLNTTVNSNKWHHLVMVLDAEKNNPNTQPNTFRGYLDGVMFAQGDGSELSSHSGSVAVGGVYGGTHLDDGTTNDGHYFKGYIDEVEIYNIALDDRAVKDIYNFEKNHKNYDGTTRDEVLCGVDLSVTKTANPSPNVGAQTAFTYTITVKNNSIEPLTTGFTLHDTMPSGLIVDTNATTYSNADFTCVGNYDFNCTLLPDNLMQHNDTRSVTITAIAPNTTGQALTNSASVHTGAAGTAGQPDPNQNNNNDSVTITTLGTDLGITKTGSLDANGSNLIHYTMTVTNHSSLTPAKGVSIIDNYDSRLSLITPPDSISCTIPASGHYFTCTLPDIAPGGSISFTSTMQAQSGTNIINDINVSSYTVDTDLSNNHAQIAMDINVSGTNAPVKLKDGFRKHVSTNNYGNMIAIGNTILKANNQDGNTSLTDVNTSFINVAAMPLNSSSATLNIPENNITIEYAGLYWGGHIKGKDINDTLTNTFNTVKLTIPSGNTYTITGGGQENGSITNDDNTTGFYRFKRFDNSIGRLYYSSEANITSILREAYTTNGTINGVFTVSDLNVSYGLDNTASFIPDDTSPSHWSFFNSGFFGGWELVVIYSVDHRQYRSVRYKNSTIFDGFKVLMPRSPGQSVSLDLNVSGFITPHVGDIESTLFSMVFAGDMTLPYESMSVTDISGTPHLVDEGGGNTNNIFNDTISLKNIDTTPISKNLNLSYNPGVDLDEFDLTSQYDSNGNCISTPCYLSNAQTSTKINLQVSESGTPIPGTTQYPAQYAFVNMLGFNTQIFTPDFIDSYKECFKKKEPGSLSNNDWVPCSNPMPPIHRGSILKYRITIINSGTDDAIDVHVTDPLPKEVDFNGSCASPNNDITATNIYDLPDGIINGATDLDFDYNSTLRSISGECKSTLYDYNQSVRDECVADIKAVLIDGNETTPLGTIPDGNGESMNLVNPSYNNATCSTDNNITTLVFNYPSFPKKSVTWIEFYTKINGNAVLGQSFQNAVSINFTNQTLSDAGINNLQTQQSEPVDSGTVTFNWEHITTLFKDPGRNSVGTKIVNKPFDLNISLTGISSLDVDTGGNTTMSISNLKLVDAYNNSASDITSSLISPTVAVDNTNLSWATHNTNYNKASKEIGFKFDLTLSYNDYNETKHYPGDFNLNAPYAGDVFTTRPKNYTLAVTGASNISGYTVIKAAQPETLDVNATDESGSNSLYYNAVLSKTNGINISLDNNFSANPACIDINSLNINNLTFTNGTAQATNTKYNEVGVIKFDLTDSNWTLKDQTNGDCIVGSGTNTAVGGIIGCNVEGNSSSIVFIPDQIDFNATQVSDYGNGFTYMITNPATDQVYGKLTTNVISKNMDGNITKFFSGTCFADNVQINLGYNVDSLSLNDLTINIANESNLSNIDTNASLSTVGNTFSTKEQNSSFANGVSIANIRIYMDRNKTATLEPAIVDNQDINGSIDNYLGIAGVNINPVDKDISATNNLHFIYGRIHAPNYSSDNDVINAKIYYEGYCKDCNKSKFSSLGGEDADSIYWYINTGQNTLSDGNISGFIQPANTKINISPPNSTVINNGNETHTITYIGNTYPYREKVDINASSWLIYNPYDANASTSSFFVDFTKYNDWAGVGATGKTVDINISSKGSKRIEW